MVAISPNVGTVGTISDLKNVEVPPTLCPTVLVEGYHAAGDGGGGEFRWVDTPATDDGGLVINPNENANLGHWQRVYDGGEINCRWFGASPTETPIINTAAIQAIIDEGASLYIPRGDYAIGTVLLRSGTRIRNDGRLLGRLSTPHQSPDSPFQVTGTPVDAANFVAFNFASGGTYQVQVGDTLTGATSGATAVVKFVQLSTGSWAGGDATGIFQLSSKTGTFVTENLNVGANLNVASIAVSVPGQDTFPLALPYKLPAGTVIQMQSAVTQLSPGSWVLLSLHDAATDGDPLINQRGYQFAKIQTRDVNLNQVTLDRALRMGFPRCKIQLVSGVVEMSGALNRGAQAIMGDLTPTGALTGTVLHIENLNGDDTPWTFTPDQGVANNFYRCYFERFAVRTISSASTIPQDDLLYTYSDFIVAALDYQNNIRIEGGYIDHIRIVDASNVDVIEVQSRQADYLNVYGGSVVLPYVDGQNLPPPSSVRPIGLTFCCNMILDSFRAKSATSSTNNGSFKMNGCSRMNVNGVISLDSTATAQSESLYFNDFFVTPYSLWSQQNNYGHMVLGKPKGGAGGFTTSMWIVGSRYCVIDTISAAGMVRLSKSMEMLISNVNAESIWVEECSSASFVNTSGRFYTISSCTDCSFSSPTTTGAGIQNESRNFWIRGNCVNTEIHDYKGLDTTESDTSIYIQDATNTRIFGGRDVFEKTTHSIQLGSSPGSVMVLGGNWLNALPNQAESGQALYRGDQRLRFSAFDRDRLAFNDTYLFRDTGGRIRQKTGGAPTTDTDGNPIVGYATSVTSPVGSVPLHIGRIVVNTTSGRAYIAHGLTGDDWDPILHQLTGSKTFDWPSIPAVGYFQTAVTVGGAVVGDSNIGVSMSAALPAGMYFAQPEVTAADTVTVTLINGTGSALNPASGTLTVRILK